MAWHGVGARHWPCLKLLTHTGDPDDKNRVELHSISVSPGDNIQRQDTVTITANFTLCKIACDMHVYVLTFRYIESMSRYIASCVVATLTHIGTDV